MGNLLLTLSFSVIYVTLLSNVNLSFINHPALTILSILIIRCIISAARFSAPIAGCIIFIHAVFYCSIIFFANQLFWCITLSFCGYTVIVLIDIDQNYPPDTKDNLLILPFFTSGFSIELPEVFLFFPDLSWLTKDGCYTIPKGTHMLVSNDSKRNTDCFRKGNTYENKKNICADRRYSACGTIRFNCGFCSVRQSECHLFVQSFYLLYSYYSSHLIQLCFGVQDFWPQKTRFAIQFRGSIFKKITFVNKIYISFMIQT